MSLTAKPTGEAGTQSGIPVALTAGIYYAKGPFLAWDGWASPSRRYLSHVEDEIPLNDLFLPHFEKMKAFDSWFDSAFRQHHRKDYDELEEMTDTYLKLKKEEGRSQIGDGDA